MYVKFPVNYNDDNSDDNNDNNKSIIFQDASKPRSSSKILLA